MCPSFRATGDEKDTTRARANVLRELLARPKTERIFDQPEVLEILDNCVSCKACKSECPSNVDMARYKAEFLQHHYDVCGVPLKALLVANLSRIQRWGMYLPSLYNGFISNSLTGGLLKKLLRFAPERSIPKLYKTTLRHWAARHRSCNKDSTRGKIYLFADEFTDYMDVRVGIRMIELLSGLGYEVVIPEHVESGRTALSKGLLKEAKKIARKNVVLLKDIVTDENPLVGIEPSCIHSFRDEYPDLVGDDLKAEASSLGKIPFDM